MNTPLENLMRILAADDLARENKQEPGAVLKLASAIAEPLQSEVHLVHAYEMPHLTVPSGAMDLIEGPYVDAVTKALDEESEAMRLRKPNLKVHPSVEKGKAIDVLLHDIETRDCQLVVVATHGRHGMKRAVLGSVAEEVIRRSSVPVLAINPGVTIRERFKPRKILVALDMSETSPNVVKVAGQFAKVFGASLTLTSVIEEWVYPIVQSASLLAGGFVMTLERDLNELGSLRNSQLKESENELKKTGLIVETKLIERATSVAGAILSEAQTGGFDMIVMGHRHASRLEYALLGSVSRYVVRESTCPVLIVPPEVPPEAQSKAS